MSRPAKNGFRYGLPCSKHPELMGKRYNGNGSCVECERSRSKSRYASRNMTVSEEITILKSTLRGARQEIEHLKSQVSALQHQVAAGKAREWDLRNQVRDARESRDKIGASNRQLRKDARRYRWLRDLSQSINQFYLSVPSWFSGVKFRGEDVDKAIDQAISQEKTK